MNTLFQILLFHSFAQQVIPFTPVYPINTIVYDRPFNISWEILQDGYEYKVEVLRGSNCKSVKISLPYTTGNIQSISLDKEDAYCWRLKYRLIEDPNYYTSDLYKFTYKENQENEESLEEDILNIEEYPEISTETIIEKPIKEEEEKKEIKQTESIVKKNISLSEKENNVEDVLGKNIAIQEEKPLKKADLQECELIFNKKTKEYKQKNCDLKYPNIEKTERYSIDENYDYILIEGSYQDSLHIKIIVIDYEKFSILKPSTWFKRKEIREERIFKKIILYYPSIKINGKRSYISTYIPNSKKFLIKVFTDKVDPGQKIKLSFNIYFYLNIDGYLIDIKNLKEKDFNYTDSSRYTKEKPLQYIFNSIIGVTQWHGYTDYASPHTGIDFGSVKEPILCPSDGTIYAVGWDNYYGECNSGGKYIKIKHNNGTYTVYMHLKDYTKEDGNNWRIGEPIYEGEQVGISGNTGAYNCQTLGYHLHYELRENSQQSSHLDPVPYTNIEWNLIPTINWQTYPGRLSGDNPHPNF